MVDAAETFRSFEFLYKEDGVEEEDEFELREEPELEICPCEFRHSILPDGTFCRCQCSECDCGFCNECKRLIAGDYYEEHIRKCGGGEE